MSRSPYACAQGIKEDLLADGWVSPDTYSNFFAPVTRKPAVYLFLRFESDDYKRALVAYVGMSKDLQQRLNTHNILPLVQADGSWVMRWFKPTRAADLRTVEDHYIKKFDPPWNIIGRPRGLVQ